MDIFLLSLLKLSITQIIIRKKVFRKEEIWKRNQLLMSETKSESYDMIRQPRKPRIKAIVTRPNDRTQFLFPPSREMFETIQDKYHLRDLILAQGRKYEVTIPMHTYGFQRNQRAYLYTKCVACNHVVKMKFLKIQDKENEKQNFKLIMFDNTHNHDEYPRRVKHNYNMLQIFHIWRQQPRNMPTEQFRIMLKDKYNLNDSQVYYILHEIKKRQASIVNIIWFLKKNNNMVWTELFKVGQPIDDDYDVMPEEEPQFLMFALPRMLENFQRYGECCYFSIIKGLIQEKNNLVQIKEWDIIGFHGLSFHNRFAPFALAFLQKNPRSFEQTIQLIRRVFLWGKKTPKTLITPSQPIYTEIVKVLRQKNIFHGLHIFDALQELQYIEKVLNDSYQLKFFQDIVQSKHRAEYNQNVQRLFKHVVPSLQVRKMYNSLQEKASKMCFALIETDHLIGMGFRYSANRYMSIMVRYLFTHNSQSNKVDLPRPKELYRSIKFLAKEYMKISEPQLPYIRYDALRFENFMCIEEMKLIRNRIKMAVIDIFLGQISKALTVDVRQRPLKDPNYPEMKIYDVVDKNARSFYIVAPRPEYNQEGVFKRIVWKCSCLYSVKCGMPCSHQIKVVSLNKGSLLDQVHQRWIQPKIGSKKAPGRPKTTRRNTIK